MRTNILIKYAIVLLSFLWVSHSPFVSAKSGNSDWTGDRHYRDSLRQHILATGSASVDCYLTYPIGSYRVDPGFGNNAEILLSLRRFLSVALNDSSVYVQSVHITGYSSLDGAEAVNEQLSHQRATWLLRYLESYYRISDEYRVEVHSVGADWVKFRELIASSYYTWKTDALLIIDSDIRPDRKKLMLAGLSGGVAHRCMYEELYPRLRRVEVRINFGMSRRRNLYSEEESVVPEKIVPTVTTVDTVAGGLKKAQEESRAIEQRREKGKKEKQEKKIGKQKEKVNAWMALKTNLLFDAALVPNVELEVPIGRSWSLNADYLFPWWTMKGNQYCAQALVGTLEGRYWLGNRDYRQPLAGHFVGLYAGGGKYDLQWKEKGYRDNGMVTAGATYGYSLSMSRHFNMEFSLGVGMLYTKYKYYRADDAYRTLVWKKNGRLTWLGPTKAKISLVWLMGNKKGGGK